MFALLISLFVTIHMTAGTKNCSFSDHKTFYEDDSKWVTHVPAEYPRNEAQVEPLPFMIPYTKETSGEINKQINRELFAHHTYLSMAMHFDRDDINLPGFHKFFKESAEEEMEHAQKFMKYQNMRGGRVKLRNIHKPCEDEWGNGLNAMKIALKLEKEVYESLLVLHGFANQKNDPQLQDFLEGNFLGEQVESIKQLANYVNTLTRLEGSGNYQLGEYQFDKITLTLCWPQTIPGIAMVITILLIIHKQCTQEKKQSISIIPRDRASREKKVCLQRSSQCFPKKLQS